VTRILVTNGGTVGSPSYTRSGVAWLELEEFGLFGADWSKGSAPGPGCGVSEMGYNLNMSQLAEAECCQV
jgi:hypothetical protein